MLEINIPSKGRSSRLETLDHIPEGRLRETRVIVPQSEFSDYRRDIKHNGVRVVPCPAVGIADTRQWVMENSKADFVLFCDDDMHFSVRYDCLKLTKCTTADVEDMLRLLEGWLSSGLVHVGVSQRAGNNNCTEECEDVTRMNNIYAYNRKKFLEAGVKFNRLKVMEDFDVTLSLLRLGHPNRVSYKYAWGQRKSGDKGGCSTYRTAQMQHEAATQLANLHRGFVTIIKKESKVEWEGIGFDRTDVIISWKEAYESYLRAQRKPMKGLFTK